MTTVVEFTMLSSCLLGVGRHSVQFFGAGVDSVLILHYVKLQYFFVTLTKAGVI